jgi:hypothetical protein
LNSWFIIVTTHTLTEEADPANETSEHKVKEKDLPMPSRHRALPILNLGARQGV